MNATRTSTCAVVSLVILLVLVACSSGGGGAQSSGSSGGAGTQNAGAGSAAADGGAQAAGPESENAAVSSEQAEVVERDEPGRGATGAGLGELNRRVVRDAELGLVAEDVRRSAEEAQGIAAGFGGSVLSSRVYETDGRPYAEVVLAVPSGRFEEALAELRGLGRRVTTETVTGEDVTEEFVDLKSRERNLLAAEESLLRLYDRAESVEDTLDVQYELTEVRGQIEQVRGRIEYLENRTDFSRISLTVEPTTPAVAGADPAWSPGDVAARAWEASLGVLQALATAVISAVVFAWWLLPPMLAGLFVYNRRRNRPQGPPAPDS